MKMVHLTSVQYSMRPCDYGDGNEINYPSSVHEYTSPDGRTFCMFPPPPRKAYDYLSGRFKRGDLHCGYLQEVANRVWNPFADLRISLLRKYH